MKKIEHFEYDFNATDEQEVIVVFKVDKEDCEMKIPKKDLERMLWIANNHK